MKKKNKFEKGYLTYRKNRLLLNIFINILSGLSIFVIGLLLNKMEAKNIFSVVALLFILPVGRSAATFFILLPFKEPDKGYFSSAEEAVKNKGLLLYSPVFTSAENVMHFDLLAVFSGKILAFKMKNISGNQKEIDRKRKTDTAKAYIDKHINNQGRNEKLTVYEDLDKFIKAFPEREATADELSSISGLAESMRYFVV